MSFKPFGWKRKSESSTTPLNPPTLNAAEEALAEQITNGAIPLPPSVVSASATGGVLAWGKETEYKPNQLVTSDSIIYICIKAHKSGESFSGVGTNWAILAGGDTVKTIAEPGETPEINLSEGTAFQVTLNKAEVKPTFVSLRKGKCFTLELIQDGTGNRVWVWPVTCRFPNGITPVLSTAAGAADIFYVECFDGEHWAVFPSGYSLEAGGKTATVPPVVQTALNLKQDASAKEAANGYAGLDGLSRLPLLRIQPSIAGDLPTTFLQTMQRKEAAGGNRTPTTKLAGFTYFTPDTTRKVKKLKTVSNGTLASGCTFAKFAIYTVGETGILTCVARTKSEPTLFEGSTGIKELSILDNGAESPVEITEYELVRGTRYAFAILIIATTMPQLLGTNWGPATTSFLAPVICSVTTENQTDLSSSYAANKVAGGVNAYYGIME